MDRERGGGIINDERDVEVEGGGSGEGMEAWTDLGERG